MEWKGSKMVLPMENFDFKFRKLASEGPFELFSRFM